MTVDTKPPASTRFTGVPYTAMLLAGRPIVLISPILIARLVIMALVTTLSTTPPIQLLRSFEDPVPRPGRVAL